MKVQIRHSNRLPRTGVYPGRKIMTCCEDDISFFAYPCNIGKAKSDTLDPLDVKDGEWVMMLAKVHYRSEHIMLNGLRMERAKPPKEAVVNF